ncbi:sialidase family protein [Parabacteroides pacaensis]|uniref:sialidase family protein n=1 Tax=Parabacteroides pacaensis TaxID=2086575 RepID=UPI001F44D359|nr:sialidase family protein [Parabacteroides pacaensis]
MKNYIYMALCILFLGTTHGACGKNDPVIPEPDPVPTPTPTPDPNKDELQYVYQDNLYGYECFRIPAIVKTQSGILLAFAEARKFRSNGDSGDIDLVVRSSKDNGKTWNDPVMIWDDGENTCGNPVPIVDNTTGRIHLLMTWNDGRDNWSSLVNGTGHNTRRPYYTYSDDEGKTWVTPRELTQDIKHKDWDWYGTGPVHGIQIQHGPHKGRLVSPNYFTIRENGIRKDYSHIVFSDDGGTTWKAGKPAPGDKVGECTVAELPDGTLMLNLRPGEGNFRYYTLSTDGGESWGPLSKDAAQLDPRCQGSLISTPSALFLSNANSTERVNMTIKMSPDNGKSWDKEYVVYEGPSGYSDMVMLSDNEVAVLYEGGKKRYTEGIALKIVKLSDFK